MVEAHGMTDVGSRSPLPHVTERREPPPWSWSMRWWQWLLLVILLVASLAFLAAVWLLLAFGGSCRPPVDPEVRTQGLLTLVAVTVGLAVPWGLWSAGTRMRVPVVLAGSLAVLASLALLGYGFVSDELWTNGYCF
jgi:hypothetical protein